MSITMHWINSKLFNLLVQDLQSFVQFHNCKDEGVIEHSNELAVDTTSLRWTVKPGSLFAMAEDRIYYLESSFS